MPNYMEAAFAPAERIYKRTVVHSAFGHLRAASSVKYAGSILFCHGIHGDITIIDWKFSSESTGELEASPWVYEHIQEYVQELILPQQATQCELETGKIYKFTGTYEIEDDEEDEESGMVVEGQYRFEGDVVEIPVPM